LLDSLPELFPRRRKHEQRDQEALTSALYQQIGQLKVELDWLKKNLDLTIDQKHQAVEPRHKTIPIIRQCKLLGLNRSSLYYNAKGETEYNEMLMKLIDEQYVKTPFYGIDKMTKWLRLEDH